MHDTDMILSRSRFVEMVRKLFGAKELLNAARPYVEDFAKALGRKSESANLLASIDEFLERTGNE